MNYNYNKLQNEFKNEAINAPMLFKDLAKVEQYIAESYKTRSFIELIQNADDAGSKNFGIHIYDNYVIVGNDGRDFTNDDIKSICRSGSSNKIRGGSTIGYRGIGFKSVANLAERIYVISGNSRFLFDKEITKKLLNINDDVPLIRIPHIIDKIPYEDEINRLKEIYSYTTFFLFENIKENVVEDELKQFDKSSVLFLNSVNIINLICRKEIRKIEKETNSNMCKIIENGEVEEWMIISDNDKYDKVAFKIKNKCIISANASESVIHSFTPTMETAGGYFKMNGNFSTDPSRKNIDFDDLSEHSFQHCTKIIADIIKEIMQGNNTYVGFFKPFIEFNNAINSNKLRVKLLSSIKEILFQDNFFVNLRLKPEILSIEDYIKICNSKYTYITENILVDYPEINAFFELIDIKYLSIDEMLNSLERKCKLSEVGLATILGKSIKKYRYDFSDTIVKKISRMPIFITKKGQVDASSVKKYLELSEKYRQVLNDNCDTEDIRFALKKIGIEFENDYGSSQSGNTFVFNNKLEINKENMQKPNFLTSIFSKKENREENKVTIKENSEIQNFNKQRMPHIQKWRSTEVNLAEYLRCFDSVETVKDVSISNLGYDIEVKLKNGQKLYIEVKSMISFSQPFKITNNDYTCAHNYGNDYYIALVINDDNFQVKFIKNPIECLHFEKKCEQWSWFCEDYKFELLNIEDI